MSENSKGSEAGGGMVVGHTPGPWTIHRHGAESRGCQMHRFVGADGQGFAYTVGLSTALDIGNARLIAAAPQLLEALIEVVDDLEAEIRHRYHPGVMHAWAADDLHPAQRTRYDRDMEPIARARAAIRSATQEGGTEG